MAKRKKQQRDCSSAFARLSPRASSRPEYDSAVRHLRWTGSVYSWPRSIHRHGSHAGIPGILLRAFQPPSLFVSTSEPNLSTLWTRSPSFSLFVWPPVILLSWKIARNGYDLILGVYIYMYVVMDGKRSVLTLLRGLCSFRLGLKINRIILFLFFVFCFGK